MAMFDAIGDILSGGNNLSQLAGSIGGTEDGTKTAAAAAVPLLLGGLQKRTATQQGAQALFNMVQSDDGSLLDRIPAAISGGDSSGLGSTLVGSILGGRRSTVEATLAQSSGLSAASIAKFLPMVAPMVMGFLGRKQSAEGLDRDGVKSALAAERGVLDDVGFGQWMGLLDGGDPVDDDKGFQSGLAKIAGLGGLGLLGGGVAKAVTSAPAAVTSQVTSAATAPKIGASAPTTTSPTVTTRTGQTSKVSTGTTQRTDYSIAEPEKKRGGWLKWLLPLLLAGLLALVLWSCLSGNDDDDQTATPEPTAVVEESTAVPTEVPEEPTAVPTEVPTEVPEEPTPVPPTEVPAEPTAAPEPEIVGYTPGRLLSTAEGAGSFTTLLAAIDDAGLRETLEQDGPFTVLAPIDSAFEFLPPEILEQLDDPAVLDEVLRYHVIPDNVVLADFPTGQVPSVGGGALWIDNEGFQSRINGAVVLDPDLQTENGLIQVIDRVLVPPSILRAVGLTVNDALSLEPILFEVGSAELTAEGQAVLDGAIPYLSSTDGAVEIGGHTDSDGTDEDNLALSQARADTVLGYLVGGGIAQDRLTAVGYGEANPVASNDTPTGKEANRRIEFTLQ